MQDAGRKGASHPQNDADLWGPDSAVPASSFVADPTPLLTSPDPTGQSVPEPGTEPRPNKRRYWFAASAVGLVVALGVSRLVWSQSRARDQSTTASDSGSTSPTTRGPNSYVAPQVGPGNGKLALAVAMTRGQSDSDTLALSQVRLTSVSGLAAASDGRLFVSDNLARVVYEIAADNTSARIVAGSRSGVARPSSVLRNPTSLVVDSFGALVIADNPAEGLPGRVVRQDPTGEEKLMFTTEREIVGLHADEFGSVFVHLGPVTKAQATNAVVRISDTGEITEQDLPLFTDRLFPVSGGSWLGVGAQLKSLSLFDSPEMSAPLLPQTENSFQRVIGVSGDRFITVTQFEQRQEVRSVSADGVISKFDLPADSYVWPIAATRRNGSLVLATSKGLVFFSDPAKLEAGAVEFVKMVEAPTADAIIPGLPVDFVTLPSKLAVGPDGTVYWGDNFLTSSLLVLSPQGVLSSLRLPETGYIAEMVVFRNYLLTLVYSGAQLKVLRYPLDTLQGGQEAQRAKQREVLTVTESEGMLNLASTRTGQLFAHRQTVRDDKTLPKSLGKTLRPKSRNVSDFAVDPDGFALFVVDEGRIETSDGTIVVRSEAAASGTIDPNVEILGLPDNQVGSLRGWEGAIAAIGPKHFVLADTQTDRLMELEEVDGTWMIRRFAGLEPETKNSTEWLDPVVQRTIRPRGVVAGPDGSVYFIAEGGSIRRIDRNGTVRTLAGGGLRQPTAFGQASGLATLPQSDEAAPRKIVVADAFRHRVNVLTPEGDIGLLSGTGSQGQLPGDLSQPSGIAELDGVIYVADTGNHRVLSIDESGFVTVVAGTGRPGNSIPLGLATRLDLNSPNAVAVAPDGRVIIADTENNRVLVVNTEGQVAKLFTVRKPSGLAMSTDESVFISARSDGQVFRLKLSGGSAEVIAGRGVLGYEGDGDQATKARLSNPGPLAAGPDGSLYIGDAGNGAIRRVAPNGVISTVSGGSGEFGVVSSLLVDPKLGVLFGDSDGRLFSISTNEMTRVVPGWDKAR